MSKKIPRSARRNTTKAIGTCSACGAPVYDGQPMTCCVRGALAFMAAVVEHAAELAAR